MTLAELVAILGSTNFPVAYSHFSADVPSPPFITYLTPYSSNFAADNKTYQKINNVQIELYTDKKDLAAEQALEDVLDAHDIPYETTEGYIESEKLFQRIYEIGVVK